MDATQLREIETSDEATEVVVLWGAQVLHVTHVPSASGFAVGEATDARGRPATDYLIGRESLGVEHLPIVVATEAGIAVVVADDARASVGVDGEPRRIETLTPAPSACAAGTRAYLLPPRATARIEHREFTFIVTRTRQAARIARVSLRLRWEDQAWIGAATLAHVALLAMFHLLPPHASALSAERLDDRLRLIPIELMPRETEDPLLEATAPGDEAPTGEAGRAHEGEAGEMGKVDAPKTRKRHGVRGPEDNPDPHLARDAAREQLDDVSILGTLKQFTGSWESPTSPFGRETALGRDPMAALGALLGATIGESGGRGGLAMSNTGRGGGGPGLGTIGLDRIGTLGTMGGTGSYGSRTDPLGPRGPKVPPPILGRADVRGALSREVIQRVIRRHVAEVRHCYEQALPSRPDLEGRVAVKFVISPSGAVQTAVVEQSALGHAGVEACITRAVERWAFPTPEGGGIVIVSYPFTLSQPGG